MTDGPHGDKRTTPTFSHEAGEVGGGRASRFERLRGILWMALVLIVALGLALSGALTRIETDVMALLPVDEETTLSVADQRALSDTLSSQVLWVVEGEKEDVEALYAGLAASGLVTELRGPMTDAMEAAWGRAAFEARLALADPTALTHDWTVPHTTSTRTNSSDAEDIAPPGVSKTLSLLFSPLGPRGSEVVNDPFLLTRQSRLLQATPRFVTVKDGWLTVTGERDAPNAPRAWLLSGSVAPGHATGLAARATVDTFKALEATVRAQASASHRSVQIWHQGAIWHSAEAAQRAQTDMTRLGGASLVLLALLLLTAYRSLLPLVLTFTSIAAGAIMGIAATIAVFGSIHSLTLVMCLSLVGICADYTTYVVTRHRYGASHESGWRTIAALRPTLWHALLSTVAAYGLMGLAPFPGLRQLALFAVVGIASAWVTVMWVFPFFVARIDALGTPAPRLAHALAGVTRHPRAVRVLVLLWTLVAVTGLVTAHYSDDLRMLQTPSATLTAHEAAIKAHLGEDFSQTGFVVTAPDAETLLTRLEALRQTLAPWETKGIVIPSVTAFPLPEKTQAALRQTLREAWGPLERAYADAGVALTTPNLPPVYSLSDWLASPLGAASASMLRTPQTREGREEVDRGTQAPYLAMIPVRFTEVGRAQGAQVTEALKAAGEAIPGVVWQNRRAAIERALGHTKTTLFWLLGASVLVLSASLIHRFGRRRGIKASGVLALSLLTALASTVLIGEPINLFSLFALIVVLGVGIDYVVYYGDFQAEPETSLRAMTVALLSTLFSLGILTLSGTAAVVNFGWVLTVGVASAFVLAPLVLTEGNAVSPTSAPRNGQHDKESIT